MTMAADSGAPPDSGLLGFERGFDRPSVPFRYRLGLLATAAAMVLLPLIYLALTAGAAYLVYLQATQGVVLLGAGWVGALFYMTPLAAGTVRCCDRLFQCSAQRGMTYAIQ